MFQADRARNGQIALAIFRKALTPEVLADFARSLADARDRRRRSRRQLPG